jgi:flavin reductase (DIM6/NTAB) family NADH-FMN oxidoreductase RutF
MSDSEHTDDSDHSFDPGHFRGVMGHFPTGVTVVSGMDANGTPHGFTIGSFTSVSLAESGSFCVNVLSDQQSDLCWNFAKSDTDATRFDGVDWHAGPSGSPILDRAVAWIDCTVEHVYDMGDHHFVLGNVVGLDADVDHDGQPPVPLLFFKGTLGGFATEG